MEKPSNNIKMDDSSIAYFKTLKTDPGWQLLVQIVQENIRVLQHQILTKYDSNVRLTEEELDRKREKLMAYEEVISTPDEWINRLEQTPIVEEDQDPYFTPESLADLRKRQR